MRDLHDDLEAPTSDLPAVSPNDARRLISAALTQWADETSARLEHIDPASNPAADIGLARTMAQNVTGWTHTTRLRDFLEAEDNRQAVADWTEQLQTAAGQ